MAKGEMRPERNRVTRDTVARHAKVSTAVVSYILNNGPRPVAAATRARVLEAIRVLDFRPNSVARALRTQRTQTLGLLVPDNGNPFFAELAKAVEDAAYARGHALLLANSSNDPERERSQLQALRDRQVDGLLIIGTTAAAVRADLEGPYEYGSRIVFLDRAMPEMNYPCVVVDNEGGARAGVEHLIAHGHRRIFCIAGPEDLPAATEREAGWRAALVAAGLQCDGLMLRTPFTRHDGYEAGRKILGSSNATAIFASSDLQGVGVLRACYEANVRVPSEMAVLAFDGTQESEFTSPPLAVIRQDLQAIASAAVSAALERPSSAASGNTIVQCTLVPRQSCGCDPLRQ